MGEFELIRRCFDWNGGFDDSDVGTPNEISGDLASSPINNPKPQSTNGSSQILLGISDDAALIQTDAVQAICTDSLIQDTHFVLETPSEFIGYKSLAVN